MPYGTLSIDQIIPDSTLNITGNVATTGTLAAPNFSSTNALGVRNRIINGAMAIDQRNAGNSQTITAGAALAYTVDRWYAYCTGANVTGQRVAGTGNNQFAYRFTGAASVTAIGFGQRIEAINCFDLAGSTATLSVELSNSLLTTVTWTAFYANTSDTFGTLASPTKTQIANGTFTVNSTLTRYTTQIAIPIAATTGIEILFTVGAQTSGTWIVDNVQLEAGTVATPFERRPIGLEEVFCQRYFTTSYYPLGRPGSANIVGDIRLSHSAANSYSGLGIFFPIVMRSTPTMTLYNPNSGALNSYRNYNTGTDAACVVGNVGPRHCWTFSNGVNIGAGNIIGLHYAADIEL